MGIFVRNFTRLLSNQIYTLSPSFIEIFLELTKLHSFNHDVWGGFFLVHLVLYYLVVFYSNVKFNNDDVNDSLFL